jgi:recombination protein RecR
MSAIPRSLLQLINDLTQLPSIGEKSATRLAYHMVTQNSDSAKTLAQSIIKACNEVTLCSDCFALSESKQCSICSNTARDRKIICAVEKPIDLFAIEKLSEYKGLYHVLHGVWSPLKGIGRAELRIDQLLKRALDINCCEIIIATSVTVDGDATALYISKLLAEHGIKTSRLAQGMPKGGELEYADELTLSRAFSGRRPIIA